jgi:hypothetical protein
MQGISRTTICYRNDDVNDLSTELADLSEIFLIRGVPLAMAVEPGNLTDETASWLLALKARHGSLVEIVQHGWNHTRYSKGEFDGSRSYVQQFEDLKRGKEKLESVFRMDFFPMLTIPFGVYTADTVLAASHLKYKVFSGHYDYRISRRIFYLLGHLLGKGKFFGHSVSNHLKYYPGTKMFEIDTSISFIKQYLDPSNNTCSMYSLEEILLMFEKFRKLTTVVVFLLHHRFHREKRYMELVERVVDELQKRDDVRFASYEEVYLKHAWPPMV